MKSGEKWGKVVKSREKWGKVGKSSEKWGKVGKSGETWEKVVKRGKKWGKGLWRPFWMTENHFRSHFSPFQINTQLFFFFQNGHQQPFWIPIFAKIDEIDRDRPL